jgi:thymidylate synthase (FAD)
MRLIKPYYEIESEIDGEKILRHIEKAARTCYKSEDKINDFEKTKKFVKGLITGGHHSTIEHYSISVRFIIDRGVSHELVRHRLCAFSQESTRYCNYSNEKYGDDITFIIPSWLNLEEGIYKQGVVSNWEGEFISIVKNGYHFTSDNITSLWMESLIHSEESYKALILEGWVPQQARSVLPNSLKTEIVTTCNLREWRHIFGMRAVGVAGKPHPQMLEVMIPLLEEFKQKIPIIFDDLIVKEK